jgi:AraC-like DNA-binding protein
MAVNLNGLKKDREMEALDVLLVGKSDDYKGRILEFVRRFKVDGNDPIFVLMVALGNLDVALVELPQEIDKGKKELREEIDRIATDLRKIYEASKKDSQTQTETINAAFQRAQIEIDAVESASNKLQLQIEAVEDAEERIKNKADEITVAIEKNTRELSRRWKKIEERNLVTLKDKNKWSTPHWLFVIGAAVIIPVMAIDSWRTHTDLNLAIEYLRSINDRVADISEKVGYDTVKLGRIEKYLGIKRMK